MSDEIETLENHLRYCRHKPTENADVWEKGFRWGWYWGTEWQAHQTPRNIELRDRYLVERGLFSDYCKWVTEQE